MYPDEVKQKFLAYYETLLGQSDGQGQCIRPEVMREGPLIDGEQAAFLEEDVTLREIQVALIEMGDDKTPGPDGYILSFFKKC